MQSIIPDDRGQDKPWEFRIHGGSRYINNPLAGSVKDNRIFPSVTINFSYYGEKFFFDEGFGYTLTDNDKYTLNIFANTTPDALLFDSQLYGRDNKSLSSLEKRKYNINAGAEVLFGEDWGDFSISATADVSNVHNGYDLSVAYSYQIEFESWAIRPGIGLNWRSEKLVDYYYGVRPSEVNGNRPVYRGESTIDWVLNLHMYYPIYDSLSLMTEIYYERGGSGITDSPLVERKYFSEIFIGLEYTY